MRFKWHAWIEHQRGHTLRTIANCGTAPELQTHRRYAGRDPRVRRSEMDERSKPGTRTILERRKKRTEQMGSRRALP
jgi:hypothetical protein